MTALLLCSVQTPLSPLPPALLLLLYSLLHILSLVFLVTWHSRRCGFSSCEAGGSDRRSDQHQEARGLPGEVKLHRHWLTQVEAFCTCTHTELSVSAVGCVFVCVPCGSCVWASSLVQPWLCSSAAPSTLMRAVVILQDTLLQCWAVQFAYFSLGLIYS